ncbi:nitrate reductase gamma subunit [Candidatus Magnetoovum chiemensis]|nr:nitrate reductase gamma subunit [Candidatus Magnetoovum chiemensis]
MINMKRIFLILIIFLFVFSNTVAAKSVVLLAKKVEGDLPADPNDKMWEDANVLEVPLSAQVMEIPRLYDVTVKSIRIKALHNSRTIAFKVEWNDDTQDSILDVGRFSDSLALEFPSMKVAEKPIFSMGDAQNSVNIWYWKANWMNEETADSKEYKEIKAEDGSKSYDPSWKTFNYATVDGFNPARQVDNPVSSPRKFPFENLVANGFGTARNMDKTKEQLITGDGKWETGLWKVVFKREFSAPSEFDVDFKEGAVTPIAFAVWNGADMNRGGKKHVSTWYYVGVETDTKAAVYIYPLLAFAFVAAIEYGLINMLAKRRRTL